MKKFNVTFNYVQYSTAEVTIEAKNKKEAQEIADNMASDEIDDFKAVDGELTVETLEEIK